MSTVAATSAAAAAVGTAVAGPVGTVVGGLVGSVFKTSAAGPNTDAAKAVLPLALASPPNLAAVAAFMARNGIQTQTSKQPWALGLAEIPASVQAQARLAFPTLNTTGAWEIFGAIDPTQVLTKVQQLAVYPKVDANGVVTLTQPAASPSASGAVTAGLASGTVLKVLVVATVAYIVFTLVRGGLKK